MGLPLIALLLVAAPSFSAPEPASLAAAVQAARANFLTHDPGKPTVDSLVAVPDDGGDGGAQELKLALQSARAIQLGCVLPCAAPEDVLVYRGKVVMVSSMLGVKPEQVQTAVDRYLPGGKPRLRSPGSDDGKQPAGDRLIEGKVLERILSDGRVAGQTRETLNRKALALADALGQTQIIDGETGTSASGSLTSARGLTPEQIALLNGLPAAQSRMLRDLATKPPPAPPSPEAVRPKAPTNAPEDGIISNAIAHWDKVGEDPNTGPVMRATAATLVSLMKMSNLDGFENSAFVLSESASDPSVSKAQAFKDGAAVAGNGALAIAGFLPAGAWSKLASATKLSAAGEWISGAAKIFKSNPAVAERVAALQSKALTTPLSREEAAWLGEHANDGSVIFHGTNEVDKIMASGRVAATTERYVYGARQEVSTVFRQLKAGVLPKDQLVVFQGKAAKLFSSHEATGVYSGMKKVAGQMTTNGAGDIVIEKFAYNAETKTLTILEARMVEEGEVQFILRKPGWFRSPAIKQWGRRVLLDPLATSTAGLVMVDAHAQSTGGNIFEYALGPGTLPPETASR